MKAENPILRGFHPDPSVIRVGEDYYIATSTFEWWPGVRLHHSRDLVTWELIKYPLNRVSQLDLRGVGASQGIWAPCLTYAEGIFYLVYTVVKSFYCNMYDTANYLITAPDINGPWSDPVPLNNFGFDPSLFHDNDGHKYMVSMVTDHRVPKKYAGRLVLQEYDAEKKTMTGPVREIYTGDGIYLEGPHIYKRNGWYYLSAADTGTGEGHGQSILRANDIWGPYEWNEENSILTSRGAGDWPLQKAGHCDFVDTPEGDWYAVHLCGRPLENRNPDDAKRFPGERRYTLGRETAIQPIEWTEDGWVRMKADTKLPQLSYKGERFDAFSYERLTMDDFDCEELDLEYQTLRIPLDERHHSLSTRPGYLRLYGQEGLSSKFSQSLIARRWTEFCFTAETCLEFEPEVFKQMAGLICMYDTDNYFYLHVTHDEELGKCISIMTSENKAVAYPTGFIALAKKERIHMKAEVRYGSLRFYYALAEERTCTPEWVGIGPAFDGSILSDEACDEGWFTGAMVGICCQDLTGFAKEADFDWFSYKAEGVT